MVAAEKAFLWATEEGYKAVINDLLLSGMRADDAHMIRKTASITAAGRGHQEVVKRLLSHVDVVWNGYGKAELINGRN